MARPLRLQIADGFFHVGSRGNARQAIYRDDHDRQAFLRILKACIQQFGWRCAAFCLMENHYHLLLQTPRPNLSAGMRDLNGLYAQRFHREHGTDGALFKPRFWSQLVEGKEYLLAVSRYIALNPVRARLVADPEDFEWSSHRDLISGENRHGVLDADVLFGRINADPVKARRRYAELVADGAGLPAYDPGAAIAGSPEFVQANAPARRPDSPLVKAAWEQARPELRDLVDRLSRDEFILHASEELCYPVTQIAKALGCSRHTVGRRLTVLRAT